MNHLSRQSSATNPQDSGGAHYDEAYFKWQRQMGEFGATAVRDVFQPFIRPSDVVVDFGCGGGFLLHAIDCREKMGVEINPAARTVASEKFSVANDLSEIADGTVDVVISNHALEHVADPLGTVRATFNKLKSGGLAVFVVPCERYDRKYDAGNIDRHLYTWSPMNLGNLFHHAGFAVLSCERIVDRWPPKFWLIQRLVGWRAFHVISRLYGWARSDVTQVRVVARKQAPAGRS
jgi:SAM-dependent methyltransferase